MPAVSVDRQRPDPGNGGDRQIAVKMREKIAAARRLPFERVIETVGIDGDQNEIALPGKMLGCRFAHLRGSRKVDITISDIDRLAGKAPVRLRRAPGRVAADFENQVAHARRQ